MKKRILTMLALMLAGATLSADFARVEMGAGVWTNTAKGDTTYTSGGVVATDKAIEDAKTSPYLWVLVKHPIPILPNLRLEYTSLEKKGTASGTFYGFTIPNTATTEFKFSQIDVIPYYNLLDNTAWITLDVGLDIKLLTVETNVDNVTVGSTPNSTYSDSVSIPLPMIYLRARGQIPFSGIAGEADVKIISFGDNKVSDIRVKVDYTLDITPLIQPGIELGYRVQSYDLSADDGKTVTKLGFSGPYVGVMLRF